jgi:hypothetical protein
MPAVVTIQPPGDVPAAGFLAFKRYDLIPARETREPHEREGGQWMARGPVQGGQRWVQPGGGLVADEARNPQPAARRVLGRAEGGADLLRLPGHELIDGIREDEALTLWG